MTKTSDLRGRFDGSLNDREAVYDPMDKYIDGFSSLQDNNIQQERLCEYMSNQFAQRNIDPIRVHSMADTRRTGKPNLMSILHCLKKLLPQFEDDFTDAVPNILQLGPQYQMQRHEWTSYFDVRQQ